MLNNDGYFAIKHDWMFMAMAVVTCLTAAWTAVILIAHARSSKGRVVRSAWLAVAALAGGVGIWTTHFFIMLAFVTGLTSGYDATAMAFALLVAVLTTRSGFAIAQGAAGHARALLGGAVIGCGIAATHACGMAAYKVAGAVEWDSRVVAVAVTLAIVLSAAALDVARGRRFHHRIAAAMLLAAATITHHVTALSAVQIGLDPGATVPPTALSADMLIGPVAMASVFILVFVIAAFVVDVRSRKRALAEADRMRSLADAAVEGLLIADGGTIVTGNRSLAALSGFAPAEIAGLALSRVLPDAVALSALQRHPDQPIETDLATRTGGTIPVEIIRHDIQFDGKSHQAIALRDLRGRKLAEDRIRFLAHHDPLTGLPNRAMFEARLDDAIAVARVSRRSFAALCLDLDRFKEINDLFGHPAGDDALRAVGRVLSSPDAAQLAARLGGDEFAIILPGADAEQAGRVAADILKAVSRIHADCNSGPTIGASIGIAVFPADGEDREALVGAADTALYRAKSDGRGTFRFFEAGMGAEVRDRRRIEHDLRSAVMRGEMTLVYQPQMATGSGSTVGFEALLRWQHPERGSVSPAMFVPIAEDSGSILAIGEWVLRRACAEAATWAAPLRVAVNVSAVQLHAPGFATLVEEVLAETGIDPRRLELEITETALIRDITRALSALRRLKALGIKIAMDDFGTGYSSLSNLRAFPFDRIKIDGSFIQSVDSNQQAAAIVRAIIELGRGLDLSILAEGVETAAELGFLDAELCHEVQGYLLGRPASIDHFAAATSGETPPEEEKAGHMAA